MKRRIQIGAGVLVIAGALLLAACGGGGSSPGATAATTSSSRSSDGSGSASDEKVTISNFMFSPMHLTVSPGATVSVTNRDSATHTLTATGGQFNTGDISKNQTKTFAAPMKSGTYSFICGIHQFMTGTVTVR